jgi:hypothetical protein
MKISDEGHHPDVWNLMVSGSSGSIINRDVDESQLQTIQTQGVVPGSEDW